MDICMPIYTYIWIYVYLYIYICIYGCLYTYWLKTRSKYWAYSSIKSESQEMPSKKGRDVFLHYQFRGFKTTSQA